MSTVINNQARFNARLSKEQKSYFEKAAQLGGYRSLTDFVILTVQEKAKEIILEKEQIIASERDSRIFFEAVTNAQQPSVTLKNAVQDYDSFISKSDE